MMEAALPPHAMNQSAIAMPHPASMSQLRTLVDADLSRVNAVILAHGHSNIALINDLTSHILAAGGKRLRPSLTLACAQLCGYTGARHISLAACVEFIHTATLMHDDVVDASDLRRGTATANALWGNKSSVLVGDFLLSRAFQLMVADGSLEVLKILSDAAAIISAGEVHQMMVSHDLTITQAVYEEVISAKTAALFAAACELGAVVSDQAQWRTSLRDFGQYLGMAFQMADDALDYAASASDIGKAIGDDFRDGKVTLPVIVAYANANEAERQFWQHALASSDDMGPEGLRRAKELITKHHGVAETMRVAQAYADKAGAALDVLPHNAVNDALREAAQFAVNRRY